MSKSEIIVISVLSIGSVIILLFYLINDFYINKNLIEKAENIHWYNVTFIYRDKKLNALFDFTLDIGLKNKSDILNDRILKKSYPKLNKNKFLILSKPLLCNGSLAVRKNCYLGYFPNPIINQNKK